MKKNSQRPHQQTRLLANNNLPKYTYKCRECEFAFDTFHSIRTTLEDCDKCAKSMNISGSLERIPGNILGFKNKNRDGEIVREHIKDTKEEVERYKQELKTKMVPDVD